MVDIFTQSSPYLKKTSYGLVIIMEIVSIGWISEAVLSNSFRSSRPGVLYENVCKILQNWQEITFVKVSFWWNFFEFLKYKKLRAKHKFVNGYSATKSAPLYCQLASFNFSISSSHLDLVYHQFVFLTWIHVHNLSFSVQAGFNYRLHDYFQLSYME